MHLRIAPTPWVGQCSFTGERGSPEPFFRDGFLECSSCVRGRLYGNSYMAPSGVVRGSRGQKKAKETHWARAFVGLALRSSQLPGRSLLAMLLAVVFSIGIAMRPRPLPG